MSTASGGATPPTAPAEAPVVTTPAAAPAEASSLQQESLDSRINKATTPGEILRLTRELRSSPAPAPAAEKPATEAAPAAEAPAVAEPPPEGAEPAPAEGKQPAAPAEPPEGEEPTEGGSEADGPVQPSTARRLRLQLPQEDKVGRLAAALLQRNRDMNMEEAMAKARTQLGIKSPDAAPAPAEPPKPKSDLPDTIEGVDSAISNLEAERTTALTGLEFEKVAKIDSTMRRLDRHRVNLERDAERQQAEQAASYDSAYAASDAQAAQLYEFASNPDSPGGKRMLEIEAEMKANGDPLYASPDKPLKIAQMVAAELNIAPKRKGAPPAPKAAAPVPPPPKKQVLPSGGSTTTPPPTNQPPADVAKVSGIKNLADLRRVQKELGLPR